MSRQPEQRSERVELPSVQLTVYVAEPHVGDRRSKVDELLRRAAQTGMSGGTVIAAHQGFGRHHSHQPTLWHRADETPLTAIFVDRPERIEAFLAIVDEVLPDAVAVTEHVRAIRYIRAHRH
jgi:PII-like signaling protein